MKAPKLAACRVNPKFFEAQGRLESVRTTSQRALDLTGGSCIYYW